MKDSQHAILCAVVLDRRLPFFTVYFDYTQNYIYEFYYFQPN